MDMGFNYGTLGNCWSLGYFFCSCCMCVC